MRYNEEFKECVKLSQLRGTDRQVQSQVTSATTEKRGALFQVFISIVIVAVVVWLFSGCSGDSDYIYTANATTTSPTTTTSPATTIPPTTTSIPAHLQVTVWVPQTRNNIYHSINNCGRMNPDRATSYMRANIQEQGYRACERCW